jgi:transcriptional regulator with XRE-family HTH domain
MKQESLAERLRILRARRGISVKQASEEIGVEWHTLRDLELGRRTPYYPTLNKIAEGYGVPVEDLMEEPELAGKAEAPEEEGLAVHDVETGSRVDNLNVLRDYRESFSAIAV